MRKPCFLLGFLAILVAPIAAGADEPPLPKRTLPQAVPPVISTHQIDRYDAIAKLQEAVKANPKSLADWVILGELAHEVAMDLPSDRAGEYFRMSRDAYEKALTLSPGNPGLKAAVQFARDQEANAAQLEASRDRGTGSFLEARRRELAATNYSPTLRVYGIPAGAPAFPAPSVAAAPAPPTNTGPVTGTITTTTLPRRPVATLPPDGTQPAIATNDPGAVVTNTTGADVDTANFGTQQLYSAPTYRMYYVPNNDPYTFSQFSSGYYVPSTDINPALLPMTMQRYSQQLQLRPVPATPR